MDMRISANLFDEVLVTSSGTTADFETYDFDSYTGSITVAGVFAGPGESFTISEVRLVLPTSSVARDGANNMARTCVETVAARRWLVSGDCGYTLTQGRIHGGLGKMFGESAS